jgi:hypothetical protein
LLHPALIILLELLHLAPDGLERRGGGIGLSAKGSREDREGQNQNEAESMSHKVR